MTEAAEVEEDTGMAGAHTIVDMTGIIMAEAAITTADKETGAATTGTGFTR